MALYPSQQGKVWDPAAVDYGAEPLLRVGDLYYNTGSGKLRQCTNATIPTWTDVAAGGGSLTLLLPIEAATTIVAGETVAADPVTPGRCRLTKVNAAPIYGAFLGVALVGGDGSLGDSALIQTAGPVSGLGGPFTAGAPVWLDPATPGRATATPPAGAGNLLLRVGFAYSATEYAIHVGESIFL